MDLLLDYEFRHRWSNVKKVGSYAAAAAPDTELLTAQWALAEGNHLGEVQIADPSQGQEAFTTRIDELKALLVDPNIIIHVFGAGYERPHTSRQLGIDVPIHRWRDVLVRAYYYGYNGGLGKVAKNLGVPEEYWKADSRIMLKFTGPRKPSKKDASYWWDWLNAPEDWLAFIEYARRDILAMWGIMQKLPLPPDSIQEQWELDQKINDAGIPINIETCIGAEKIYKAEQRRIKDWLKEQTGLQNPNSQQQMLSWLQQYFPDLEALNKEAIRDLLLEKSNWEESINPWNANRLVDNPDWLKSVVEAKQQLGLTAPKKYNAAINQADQHVIRGAIQFCGAVRTGRDAGRLIQPHNFARPVLDRIEDQQDLATCFKTGDLDVLLGRFPDHAPMTLLSKGIRHIVEAPKDHTFIIGDFSSVEIVVLAMLTGCKEMEEEFRQGLDTYKAFGRHLFNKPYEDLTKQERFISKPGKLGAGYGMSATGFDGNGGMWLYGHNMGVPNWSKEQAIHTVATYRRVYPEVLHAWSSLNKTAIAALHEKGKSFGTLDKKIKMRADDQFLRIALPSNRVLYLPFPEITEHNNMSYMGMNNSHQWVRQYFNGKKLTAWVTQGTARDLLKHAEARVDRAGFDIRLHVHDEIVCLTGVEKSELALTKMLEIMSKDRPEFAEDWPIKAEGIVSSVYTKG